MKIRRSRTRSVMAVLLCLTLCMTLMPTAAFASSYTGKGTETDPYMVSNWSDLRTCLTEKKSLGLSQLYVKLQSSFSASSASEINIDSRDQDMHLDLAGHKITVTGKNNQLFIIKNQASLEIKDSAGGGGIIDSSGNNQIFYVKDRGSLSIEDGRFETSSKRVVYADDDGYVDIDDGTYISRHKSGTAIKNSSGGLIRIWGGTFETRSSNPDTPVLDWGKELVLLDRFFPYNEILFRRSGEGTLLKSADQVRITNPGEGTGGCFVTIDGETAPENVDYGKTLKAREIRITKGSPVITSQPENKSCKMGQSVSLSVEALAGTSYEWQACLVTDGKVKRIWQSYEMQYAVDMVASGNKVTFTPRDGWLNDVFIRCKVTNGSGTTYSDFAQISVVDAPPGIDSFDLKVTAPVAGQNADFSYTLANSHQFSDSRIVWVEKKSTEPYLVQMLWKGKSYEAGEGLTFREGYHYGIALHVSVNKEDGYYIKSSINSGSSDNSSVSLIVNGKKRVKVAYSSSGINNDEYILFCDLGQPAVPVSGVSLNKTSLSLEKGMVETLNETVSPGSASNKGVTWKSGNSSVATVDQNGKVTAVAKGSTTITVTTKDGSRTASCTVTVTDPSAAVSIAVAVPQAGQTASQLGEPIVTNGNAAITKYRWTYTSYHRNYDMDPTTVIEMGNQYTLTVWLDTTEPQDVSINGAASTYMTGTSLYFYEFTVTDGKVLSGTAEISGNCSVGGELECTVTGLPNGAVPKYRWSIYGKGGGPKGAMSWSGISGADGPTLSLGDYAEGDQIRCTITADGFDGQIISNEITVVKELDPANPFTDVNDGDYFKDAVLWAVENGVTSGTGDTTFSPDGVCTRAQAVTFLWRANGSPVVSGSNPFTDVKSDDYFQQAVQWAVEQGITKGTSETTFSPNAYCTRAQIVSFLYRAAGSPTVSGTLFKDVSDSDYFADAVRWAVDRGITQGTTAETFSPNADCTRAQIVTFIYRQMK